MPEMRQSNEMALGDSSESVAEYLRTQGVTSYVEPEESDIPRFRDGRVLGRILPYDKAIRSALAILFVALFALTIGFALWRTTNWPDTKELLLVLIPAETALLGSAVGYYFGSRKQS